MTITPLPTPVPSTADPANFDTRADALLEALPTFVTETNTTAAQVNADAAAAAQAKADAENAATLAGQNATAASAAATTNATSTTSNTIAGSGDKTWDVGTGKSFVLGQYVRVANSVTAWMAGLVKSYSGSTLVVTVDDSAGSGTFTSWTVSLAPKGATRTAAAAADVWAGTANTKDITPKAFADSAAFVALTSSAALAPAASDGFNRVCTLAHSGSVAAPSGMLDGVMYELVLIGNGSAAPTSWTGVDSWGDAGTPDYNSASGAVNVISYQKIGSIVRGFWSRG